MSPAVDSGLNRAIDELQRSRRLDGLALYAFGHTAATEQLRCRLRRYDRSLAGILDNNPVKQGSSLGGVPILAPESVIANDAPSVVLVASRFYEQMRRQLREMGYAGEVVRVGTAPLVDSPTDDVGIGRGTRIMERLRLGHPERHLVVCPFEAFGDVYWALAYFPAYSALNGLTPAVPVVVGEGCRQVAQQFGYDEVAVLTQPEMDELTAAIRTGAADVTIAHHDRPYGQDAPIRALDGRFVAFTDMYRDLVYHLSPDTPPRLPAHRPTTPALPGVSSHALPPGRTVLLAPYAKSVLPVAQSFWEDTARRYVSDGYVVATLVHGDEEAVPGTVAVMIDVGDVATAAEYAGTFIGLRSGLCDLVHAARARKVHVVPDAFYSTTRFKVADFFALPGWESVVLPVL